MANHWDIADDTLEAMLQAYIDIVLAEPDWVMHLYKNDYVPVPGSVIGDYTEADFDGYVAAPIVNADWGSVTVALNVASSENATECEFTADASPPLSQTIYGYFVTDTGGAYLYGERFAVEKTVVNGDTVSVIAILRHATYPNP